MNSESGLSYMDKLKANNVPPQLRKEENLNMVQTVQISAEEWKRLMYLLTQLEGASADFLAQKATLSDAVSKYTEMMAKAVEEQEKATKRAVEMISEEAVKQVGNASERASRIIERSICRDEAIWFLRLALTFLPTILIFLLWLYVGLRM